MLAKKQLRRERALKRLRALILTVESQIQKAIKDAPLNEKGKKVVTIDPSFKTSLDRMKREEQILVDRLAGKKKVVVTKEGETVPVEKERWFIEIYSINLGYVKRTERKKNKGKSRKKMRKVKSVTFVKRVVAQPGMIQNFRDGKMGISPKSHTFRMIKEEPSFIN